MRAWNFVTWVSLGVTMACGGSEATLDGGDDSGTGNDVNTSNDTGPSTDAPLVDAPLFDAPDDSPITVDSGPFNPTQLGTSLVLWLDGAKGVTQTTNNVSLWADQTTNHNDASGGTGQFAHNPTLNATAINSLPAVEFGGGFQTPQYLQITDSASLQFGAGDFAIFFVAQYTNALTGNGAGQGTFYNKVAGNTVPTGPQLYGNAGGPNNTLIAAVRARINQSDNVNSTAATFNDGKYHRFGIRRNGAVLEVWTDGTATSLTPDAGGNVDVSASGSDAFIGASSQGNGVSLRLAGGIAEVIGVKGTLAGADVTSLDGYFKSKYAL